MDRPLNVLRNCLNNQNAYVIICYTLIINFQDIFGAATDTTASTLEWVMVELMRNPRAMEKAQQEVRNTLGHEKGKLIGTDISELHYLRMVIKETLRLHPSSALILRQSRGIVVLWAMTYHKRHLF